MTVTASPQLHRLRHFVQAFTRLIEAGPSERVILDRGAALLAELVAHDDWLPEAFAVPDPDRYQQYLLHCDALERFCVVSFVWAPGQKTPVHNHAVWGLVGVLRGAEIAQPFELAADGTLIPGAPITLHPGTVTAVSPSIGDIHTVENKLLDRPSISIHVYGANIGTVSRTIFDRETGAARAFVSNYSNSVLPNFWTGAA